jgi:hypothetical protein
MMHYLIKHWVTPRTKHNTTIYFSYDTVWVVKVVVAGDAWHG